MNTLLICIAAPLYIIIGLGVVALVESEYKPMSTAALWACILLWPVVVAGILALYVLTLAVVSIVLAISVIQEHKNRKENK